jgi:hypothetical protein
MSDKQEFVIVGLNSIGRTLAGLLAFSEQGKLTLVDDQLVSDRCKEQGYIIPIDLNLPKPEAVAGALNEAISNLEISKVERFDEALIERLVSKINGNTTLFFCEPMSDKARLHMCTALKNACKAIYFFGFYDDHTAGVFKVVPSAYNLEKDLDGIPTGKEVCSEGKIAAARAFAAYINSNHVLVETVI